MDTFTDFFLAIVVFVLVFGLRSLLALVWRGAWQEEPPDKGK